MMNPEQLEEAVNDLQSDAMDLDKAAALVADAISCAHGCETIEDLEANLREATYTTAILLKSLKGLHARALKVRNASWYGSAS